MILALALCGRCTWLRRLGCWGLCTEAAEPETVVKTESASHHLLLQLLLISLLIIELQLIVVLLHLVLILLQLLLLRVRIRAALLGWLLRRLRGWLLHKAARPRLPKTL